MQYQQSNEPVYVVLTFDAKRGGLALTGRRIAESKGTAVRLAERIARSRAGALALSRCGNDDEVVELARYGQIPARLSEIIV